ncbi:MAG: class I SAM-dependent methyltransferase [archaeon]
MTGIDYVDIKEAKKKLILSLAAPNDIALKSKEFAESKKILDFGCYIDSIVYKASDNKKYFGFDQSEKAKQWLKEKNVFVDFWKTEEKFDLIVAISVMEHLSWEQRYSFIKQARNLLCENGHLIMNFGFTQNHSLLGFFGDIEHRDPISPLDFSKLLDCYGFQSKVYLHHIVISPAIIFDLLLHYYPFSTVTIISKKIKK